MSHAKVQHYVPQFLLRAFDARPPAEQVYVYDKQTDRQFVAGIHKVGGETGFYDLKAGDLTLTFEPALSTLESEAALVIAEIASREQIGFLSADQRQTVARFAVVQFLRSKHFRATVGALGQLTADRLNADSPGSAERLGLDPPDDETVRLQFLRHLEESTTFAPMIEEKVWALYEAPPNRAFLLGDNPFAMANSTRDDPLRGSVGLQVTGVEIYLPLSPRLCLSFLCPTLRDVVLKSFEVAHLFREQRGRDLPGHDMIGAMKDGLELGLPVVAAPENMDYVNSLQVLWSERFVFSAHEDFTLVQTMIRDSPVVRTGPRPSVA